MKPTRKNKSGSKRPRYPMPADVRQELQHNKAMADYKARPPYQQNDYIGWITRAKHPETRHKRTLQMLQELKKAGCV